jgi:hypothetical protein
LIIHLYVDLFKDAHSTFSLNHEDHREEIKKLKKRAEKENALHLARTA